MTKKTTRGVTISVTIPKQLEIELQNNAIEVGISRSRFIANILMDWQQQKEINKPQVQSKTAKPFPNDCVVKDKDGFCPVYSFTCMAFQEIAEKCPDYKGEK